MLFTDRSILTMVHGLVFGGGAMLALAALVFSLAFLAPPDRPEAAAAQARTLSRLAVVATALVWMAVIGGTYLVFPPYRATPPEGLADLAAYPRSFLLASPGTAWLHAFAMETKEHVPWMAGMLATAVAFVGVRYRSSFLTDPGIRRRATALATVCFAMVAWISLLGVLVNKVAPLE
jgi:hypothetical protein